MKTLLYVAFVSNYCAFVTFQTHLVFFFHQKLATSNKSSDFLDSVVSHYFTQSIVWQIFKWEQFFLDIQQ